MISEYREQPSAEVEVSPAADLSADVVAVTIVEDEDRITTAASPRCLCVLYSLVALGAFILLPAFCCILAISLFRWLWLAGGGGDGSLYRAMYFLVWLGGIFIPLHFVCAYGNTREVRCEQVRCEQGGCRIVVERTEDYSDEE